MKTKSLLGLLLALVCAGCVTGAGRVVDAASDYDNLTHPPPYASAWDKGWVLPCYAISYLINGQGEFESEVVGHQTVRPGIGRQDAP